MPRERVRSPGAGPAWPRHAPQGHRVDELQVAGIEAQRKVNLLAVVAGPVAGVAQVVLHVAAAAAQLGLAVLELAEHLLGLFPMMFTSTFRRPRWAMPSTISSTPMRARFLDRQVQQRNEALGPFQRGRSWHRRTFADELLAGNTTASVRAR